jgi:D-amino-acid dehydrogenase
MKKHCVVLGAGIVGTSCAWHLQRQGLQITLIDHKLPGQSCSFGNAGCIATSGVVPLSYPGLIKKVPGWLFDPLGPMSIRLKDFPSMLPWFWKFWRVSNMQKVEKFATAQAALMHTVLADYDEILEATDSNHLKQARGSIHIYDTEKEYHAARWKYELGARLGFESNRLNPAELRSLVPCLKLDNGVGVMEPDWHHLVNPAKVTQRIAESCFADGGHWIQDRVTAVTAGENGITLQTESGSRIVAGQLVVASGAWSNAIAGQLDFKVPMIGKRGYHSQISDPGITLQYPIMSVSRAFIMTPLEDGLRVAGTSEFAALDAPPDYRRAKILLKHASLYLDGLKTEGVTEWMGRRPMMADSTPVISPSPRHPNVFYAFGHGHYGLTQGPTTGRIIAEMVVGQQSTIDLSAYRMDRFA